MLPVFKYISDVKALSKASYCAIECGDGFMQICLINKNDHHTIIAQEYFRWEIDEVVLWQTLDSSILSSIQEHSVEYNVFIHQPNFALFPQHIEPNNKVSEDILFLLTGKRDQSIIIEDINTLKIHNIYLPLKKEINILNKIDKNVTEQHFVTTWLTNVSTKSNNENKIELIFYPHYFLVIIWKKNALQLVKYIDYKTNEDILYHLLRLTDFYKFNNIELSVYLYGFIDLSSGLYENLQKYFTSIAVIDTLDFFQFPDISLSNYPAHLSTSLLSLCV